MNESSFPRRNPAGAFHMLAGQWAVIRALTLREMQGRFGRNNIGYLWMIVEPMLLAGVVTLIYSVRQQGHAQPGVSPFAFTVIGYCIFIIFRNSFNRADGVIHQSVPLFFHGPIKPFEVMIAKLLVETFGCVLAMIVLLSIGIVTGYCEFPFRPIYLILATMAMMALALGLSMIVAGYTFDSHVLSRFIQPASYLMLPLSGAFVTMNFLPVWVRPYMAWNPMFNIFEMARYGQFELASDRYFHPGFITASCAVFILWGMFALRSLKYKIHVG